MLLCLDFDGVIVDGADECLIVSWLAWNKKKIPPDPKQIINTIPTDFRNTFRELRSYVRHDGHFIVPYILNVNTHINRQHDFDKAFSNLNQNTVDIFTRDFQNIRHEFRKSYPDIWLGLHTIYPGLESILNTNHDLYIVSGKDSGSIKAICKSNDIVINVENIYGGLTSKVATLETLLTKSKQQHTAMIFCDDNLPNVIESISLGISTIWADWGYRTDEHLVTAKSRAIQPTTISQFLSKFDR